MRSNCCGNPNGGVIRDLIDVTTLGAPTLAIAATVSTATITLRR